MLIHDLLLATKNRYVKRNQKTFIESMQVEIFINYDRKHAMYEDIYKNIPECSPKYFGLDCPGVSHWFKTYEENINALDTLINLYKDSSKQFILKK